MSEAESEFEREQEQAAAAEAAGIGGQVSYDGIGEGEETVSPSQAPLIEAGEGESEGFELAEHALVQHASHADEHASSRISQDASRQHEDSRASDAGEADSEFTSERPDA